MSRSETLSPTDVALLHLTQQVTELRRQIIALHTKIATRDLALETLLERSGWADTMREADAKVAQRFLSTTTDEDYPEAEGDRRAAEEMTEADLEDGDDD